MTSVIQSAGVSTIEPSRERPSPLPVAVVDGEMPSFREYRRRHPNGYVEGYGEPQGCRLCGGKPGFQKYLHITPMSRPASIEENREGIYPPDDDICICSDCVLAIATLWNPQTKTIKA